jgi:hypothetical protein
MKGPNSGLRREIEALKKTGQPGVKYRETRVPIDASGAPCAPDHAVSVRYERIPLSGGEEGQVGQLRREFAEFKEKMYSDQIASLTNENQQLREKGSSDISSIIRALEAWSSSEGGPLVKAASPVVNSLGRKVLENYEGLNMMSQIKPLEQPTDGTPKTIVDRLRAAGLVATIEGESP